MRLWRVAIVAVLTALGGCGPDLGSLEKGETGQVVAAFNGDSLELDSGLRVFLAEIDAPRGDAPYAAQAQGELESLTLHRRVRLAYGGARRWTPRPRPDQPAPAEPPPETAIAHVFVESEGGRWFWLQHELVSRGAAYVRPRRDNHVRTPELMALEAQARAEERGLWALHDYRVLTTAAAADLARAANANCMFGDAPYRIVEASVAEAQVFDRRAALILDTPTATGEFSAVVFGQNFANWDGPSFPTLDGKRLRIHGTLGVYRDHPQICVDQSAQIEVLDE
ncbi:MAG: thermonuclease family protein [Terricaulis sp.]